MTARRKPRCRTSPTRRRAGRPVSRLIRKKHLPRQRPPKGIGGGQFSIQSNYPPIVEAGPAIYGCECQQVILAGWVADPDYTGNYTVVVNWGDGNTEQFSLLFPSSFSRPHTYADDGSYVITVTATDGAGGQGGDTTTAHIGPYWYGCVRRMGCQASQPSGHKPQSRGWPSHFP